MKPNHSNTSPRRRPDLTLPLPQHRTTSLPSHVTHSLTPVPVSNQHQNLNLSDLDRINRIGSGFRGTVYKVLHRPTATILALKVIYGDHYDDVRRQILSQIKILHGIDNLNIVKCHEMFHHGSEIQVLLEYMDRGSLQGAHLSNEPDLAHLTRQILNGLHYLHKRKIVHRNIKPSNLLMNSEKRVKISVFGVSRILEQTTHPCNYSEDTIAYTSPERINTDLNQGKDDGCAGDIWSVGVCILEFYMGILPFEVERHGDWASLMWAICMSPPPKAPPTASREFQDFVGRCLQRDPVKRWTVAQLLEHPFVTGAAILDR